MSTHQDAVDIYVGIFLTTSRMCLHLIVLTYMSASWYVGIYVGIWTCQHIGQHKNKCVDIHVGIFITISRMCRHLNVFTYMSAYWCVGTYVGIWTCQHIGQHKKECVDIYVDTSRCCHICQHIEMLTHSTSGEKYADINVKTFVLVLANMLTCADADIYVDISKCWHICVHIEMSANSTSGEKYADIYVNTLLSSAGKYGDTFRCRHICRHIKMLVYIPAHGGADIIF